MENKELYKDILDEEAGISERICTWAKGEGIKTLYELIDALSHKEKENIELSESDNDIYDNIITLNVNSA